MKQEQANKTFQFSDHVRINYIIRGSGKTHLLLLHGFGASLETWKDVQPLLEQRYRLVLVDLKGFGLSSKPDDGAYAILDQATIVIALIRYLNLRDLVLLGHSYGGSVALTSYLALSTIDRSQLIRSIVLIDSPAYPQSLPFFIRVLRTPLLNHAFWAIFPARFRAAYILRHLFVDPARVTADRVERYAKYFDLQGSHRAMIDSARQLVPKDPHILTGRIREVSVPTLIIWGSDDPLVPIWQAERLHQEIGASQLSIIPQCGHVPHEESPEETARLLVEFIK